MESERGRGGVGGGTPIFSGMNRREFLRASSASTAAAGLFPGTLPRAPEGRVGGRGKARNLIFMVADGMSMGTLTLADLTLRQRDGKSSNWVSLWNRPGVRRATATTYSADAWVTDSAAGGCAWAIGEHINNGSINVTPDGRQVMPLLVQARQCGKMTGLISTARITHATPASFIANVPKRSMEKQIAAQILERGVDVALGGGSAYFIKALLDAHAGVTVVRDRAGLAGAPAAGQLLGLFDAEHVPMVLDREETVPSLVDMTRAALARLGGHVAGFVLQVEGGRVDHAAHDNDAGSLIAEQIEFDQAIGAVLNFMEGRDDTLLVITTDHGNANPGLTFYTRRGKQAFARLPGVKRSYVWIDHELKAAGEGLTPSRIAGVVEAATGIGLDAQERGILMGALQRHRVSPFAAANVWTSVLGALLADHLGVAFTSPNHTSDMVEVTAMGPGAEALRPAIDNIDLYPLVVSAMELPRARPLPGTEVVLPPMPSVDDD